MLKKIVLILWFLIVGILVLNVISNQNMPLGFDHGPYKYFTSLYESHNGDVANLPQRLKSQFEPFSGTFLYYLKTAVGDNFLFTWLYLGAHIFISVVFFILAKHHGKYSLGSILGLLLFILSSVQYGNYAGALGKQIFATLFLLLSIRYQKKIFLNSVFLIACISLHRLTGFIAILFSFFSLLSEKKNTRNTKSIILGIVVCLGIASYIPSFRFQVLPYLNSLTSNIGDNIFIPGRYGSGFSRQDFWFFQIPLLLLTILGIIYSHTKNRFHFLKNPYLITFGCIAFLVLFRGIAHSRLQSFFDLFLLLIFIQYSSAHISKKWIYVLLSLHLILWFGIFRHDHTSAINREEARIIQKIVRGVPDNVYLTSLSSSYRAIMTGYSHRDFRDEYSHTLSQKTKKDTIRLSKDKDFLCYKLSQLDKEVFLYRGAQEKILSPLNNPCLHVIKTWKNGAQLMRYYKE